MKKLVLISLVCAFAVIGLWLAGSGAARTPVANAQAAATPTPVPVKVGIAPDRLPVSGGETTDGSGTVVLIGLGGLMLVTGLALSYRRRKRV